MQSGAAATNGEWQTRVTEQVRLNGPLLYRLAYDVLKDAGLAEDVCQNAVLKALQMGATIQNHQVLKSWLARVVINESLAIRRRQRSTHRVHEFIRLRASSRGEPERDDLHEVAYQAVEELPQPIQAVVFLRTVEGMSGNQVSELLGMSASEVSRKLHEGLDYLRRRLNAE